LGKGLLAVVAAAAAVEDSIDPGFQELVGGSR
jgi:hypothetical protein